MNGRRIEAEPHPRPRRGDGACGPGHESPAREDDTLAALLRDARHGAPGPTEVLPSPMSLFGLAARTPASAPAPARGGVPVLAVQVERLLVCDGSDGRRQVRLSLGEDSFPGTDVEIGEAGGEWLVGFSCRVDSVRERLTGEAAGLAGTLARRLVRGVCVQVTAHGGAAASAVIERAVP